MRHVHQVQIANYGNSGASAIALAAAGGAKTIIMLGYDCKPAADGRKHWHKDHPTGLHNAKGINLWPAKFERLAGDLGPSVRVINASRDTALTCFERMELHAALNITD